ncbi:MAG: excinuclease ABC subunit UvrA [Prevotellaceae bacterium]|jgi:excinuclease ABC subunit A|nr:excinuclease ABC subunit UvrA [Prevotellaceae bacterium]
MSQISIRGAKVHNLKNVDVAIPRDKLVVITGLSGSGKSTLAFDTLFAEGQRRYVESLSAYARQFLGRMNKPEVDSITGVPPAIAIDQKVGTRNPRSTVGTSTEIYDYLKLLYARIGHTFSPVSGVEVKAHSVADVTRYIASQPSEKRMALLAPLHLPHGMGFIEKLTLLLHEGFSRICIANAGGEWSVAGIEEYLASLPKKSQKGEPVEVSGEVFILVDRFAATGDEEALNDIGDSVQTAFFEGNGNILVADFPVTSSGGGMPAGAPFSSRFEADGITFEQPSEHLFSFNNPLGACRRCEGYGKVIGIDEDLVIPDKSQSVYSDAVACWRGEQMSRFKAQLIRQAEKLGFPIHKPYYELTPGQKAILWRGKGAYGGLDAFFAYLEESRYKIQHRVMLARYTGKTVCPDCNGSRLRKEALYVQVGGKNISELVVMPVDTLASFMENLALSRYEQQVAGRALVEIKNRLRFLQNVGLGYLTLNRLSNTLSGGESQRINLATSLGSNLVGALYILDEPSIGLHPRDTQLLVGVLKQLRDLGNTVVVVEHEEEIIRAADWIIDIGPMAGRQGGEIVFQGPPPAHRSSDRKATPPQQADPPQQAAKNSLTLKYLSGAEKIDPPARCRKMSSYIEVQGARENNLKNISVRFPLGGIVAVTGVSGSGKSTLVKSIFYPALNKLINAYGEKAGQHDKLSGDVKRIKNVEMVDQNPIGRSSRSNPVTYIKAYDEIRKLYADQPYAKHNGYGAAHFSFNIDGGRCEECQGDGFIKVEMQFMADVTLVCEACGGKRFKPDILEVKYKGYSISDVLDFTVNQAVEFFDAQKDAAAKKVAERLKPLQNVGLGYIKLGQSGSTLSGGESQRVKLASFLNKETNPNPILFIFDEPTTGLHFHDIKTLLKAFNALVERGHTVLVVEHNMDVVKCADWVIDLGPEGGEAGGYLCFCGTPQELAKHNELHTGKFLKKL